VPSAVKPAPLQPGHRNFLVNEIQGEEVMTVRPLHDRVLIKRIEEEETLKSGIIIPDTAKERSQEGQVISVGTGKTLENGSTVPLEVKEGDRILFGKFSGTEIKVEAQDYLILREDEIIGILTHAGKAAGKK
jgi:chaperonin GroES